MIKYLVKTEITDARNFDCLYFYIYLFIYFFFHDFDARKPGL